MILRGSIERFDLGSVLQFLAQNGATGILDIRDYEEHGRIYLVKGRLEAISLPATDDRLGVFMVRHGLVAEAHLTKVLMEEAGGADGARAHAPLGQRLADRGFVTVDVVRKAMQRLTATRMFELAHWRTGVFSYDEPEQMPEFKISIQGNVQELLLQAHVRIDHGDRPRKRTVAQHQDHLCFGCTVKDCTPVVKVPQEGRLSLAQDEQPAGRKLRFAQGGQCPGYPGRLCGRGQERSRHGRAVGVVLGLRSQHQLPEHFSCLDHLVSLSRL